MKIKYLAISGFFYLSAILNAQTTIILPVSKDAAIGYHDGANTANNNYGTAIQNAAYAIPSAFVSPGLNVNRALIDFDLSTIPAGATVMSAELNLYALGPFGSLPGHTGSNSSYLERITQNWAEMSVTWNNQPATTTLNRVTLNQSSNATQDYLNINVTSLIKDMINNPTNSFGFKLSLINETSTNSLAFASKDHSNPSLAPKLSITYSVSCNFTDSLIADYDAAIGYHDGTSSASNNYGGASQNAAYAIPSAFVSSGLNVNRALLHFNLSGIPPGATITNAALDLFAYGPVGSYPGHYGSSNSAYLERVTSNWAEYTVTWNTQPTTSTTNHVALNGTTNATLDYLNINVTSLMQDIQQSGSNNGLMLKLLAENPSNILIFCSKDHPDPARHPRLRISYTTCTNLLNEIADDIVINEIYPNPNQGSFTINYNLKTIDIAQLEIIDINGKIIKEYSLPKEDNHILIEDLNIDNGVYFCQIISKGRTVATKKLIVVR